jgi:hypothetical protein
MSTLRRTVLLMAIWGCAVVISGCGGGGSPPRSQRLATHVGAFSLFAIAPGLERDGDPIPRVGAYPDGAASFIHYSRCAPATASSCTSVNLVNGEPLPGKQPSGTLFKVTARYHGHRYFSSATWRGAVRGITRPSLAGAPRVGATIVAKPARWTGGWATDTNQLAIEACRTRAATHCVMLTGVWLHCTKLGCFVQGSVLGDRTADNKTTIGYALSGRYLFSLDARMGPGVDGLVGLSSPAALPVWHTSAIVVRSAPYGPVTGPPGPRVEMLRRAQVIGRHVIVASVRCAVRCHAWVTVGLTGHYFASGEQVAWSANRFVEGTARIGVWGHIRPGRVIVQINVGDGPYLHGHSKIN